MDEIDFWTHLEFRVCREMAGIEDCTRVGMWCDGFIPRDVDLAARPSVIEGRVWIGLGRDQEQWTFEFLLPAPGTMRAEIPWAELLPAEDTTRWLGIDRARRHLVVAPGDAVRDVPDLPE